MLCDKFRLNRARFFFPIFKDKKEWSSFERLFKLLNSWNFTGGSEEDDKVFYLSEVKKNHLFLH